MDEKQRTTVLAGKDKVELDSAYRRYTGEYSDRWNSANAGNQAVVSELGATVQALTERHLYGNELVLDIGSGTKGSFSTLLPQATHIRFDILEWRLRERDPVVELPPAVCGDGSSLPFRSGSLGLVMLSTVLSSVSSDVGAAILRESQRVVHVGGVLLIYDFRVPNPTNKSTHGVRRSWVLEQLAGCDVEIRSLTFVPQVARRLGRSTRFLYPVLAKLPFLRTHNVFVVVRRS